MTTAGWTLLAFAGGIMSAFLIDELRRWDTDRRFAAQAATVRGRHAAEAVPPPRRHDTLDVLADGFEAGISAQDTERVSTDPAENGWKRPSKMLPPELRPIPMWNGSARGLNDMHGPPLIREDIGGWVSGACL